jgi:hypothetical protein
VTVGPPLTTVTTVTHEEPSMSHLRDTVNAASQDALRRMDDYRIAHHGKRSPILDAAYEASERAMDAVEEFERLEALAHDGAEDAWEATLTTGEYQAAPLADRGNHFAGMRS